jgi:hypothetical protein
MLKKEEETQEEEMKLKKLSEALDDEANDGIMNLSTRKILEMNLSILKELHLPKKDTLDLLNTIRLNKNISDGGEHLSYDLLNHLNKFRTKNYYDETSSVCQPAIEKIIELYKENEHGHELVKDIEKVLALQSRNDEITPSPRTKEYLKRCLMLIKGK